MVLIAMLCAWLAAASCALAASQAAVQTSGLTEEPLVLIDATGSVQAAHHSHTAVLGTDDNSDRLMRHEVRRHIQGDPEKIGFGPSDEEDCPSVHATVNRKLCKILTGSNAQVAGKLERAVKGLSLRPESVNEVLGRQASSLLQADDMKSKDESKHEKVRKNTPVAEDSQFAEDVLTGLLHGDDKVKIQERLWNAINKMDIQKVLEDDIVKIEDDADGNYKALKENLLILHECATMADCPATNCCDPKNPDQANYKDARNAAYEAYHNIQHDTSLAKQTYLDLLSTVAKGKHKDYYPPSHPLYVPTTEAPDTTTEEESTNATVTVNASNTSEPAPTVEEGSMLLIAICAVTALVIVAIAFLLHKTNSMEGKGGHAGGHESWGGEGEQQYGNY